MKPGKLRLTLKWFLITSIVGILSGTASAFFLLSLEFVTQTRETHPWLLYLLPLAGLVIVFFYSRFGQKVEGGNNLILEQIHNPNETIPLRMWPLIWGGTLLTHLCGGSAGREGTAVQMGGSISDQFTRVFKLSAEERKLLLMTGISGGFASVFGTPLAGTVFAIEVLAVGRIQYRGLMPCLWTAFIAHVVCLLWGVKHTAFPHIILPETGFSTLLWCAVIGVIFGLCAWLFSWSNHSVATRLKTIIPNAYARVAMGGIVVIAAVYAVGSHKFLGLGVPVIVDSFYEASSPTDFIFKLLFTVITLTSGFKGGEVTPLFFIGATLGSALSLWIGLPVSFLAAMGLVAVFAGAANTPIACVLLALELFGPTAGFYAAIVIGFSYLCSGNRGIYHAQKMGAGKYA